MRLLSITLSLMLVLLQYKLWLGDGGLFEMWRLQDEKVTQAREIDTVRERNETLKAEVRDLKQGMAAVEERARTELGMIKQGETFYQVVGR